MTIREMQEVLDAKFLYGQELADLDVQFVFSADMMSDVLAYCGQCSVLITGLCNPQVVRTAEMLDICCIIFVRGKMPDEHMLALAKGKSIAIREPDVQQDEARCLGSADLQRVRRRPGLLYRSAHFLQSLP